MDTSQVADSVFATWASVMCAIMRADCLPVLLTNLDGQVVTAAHAGWRGLASRVLERTLVQMH